MPTKDDVVPELQAVADARKDLKSGKITAAQFEAICELHTADKLPPKKA